MELFTRTLPVGDFTPLGVYAALRAQSLDRSSYLLESMAKAAESGRYSVVGYRARAECLYPGGADVLAVLAADIASMEAPAGMLERLTQSLVGYVTYDAAHPVHDVEPWPDQSELIRALRDATVALFDHQEGTITIGSRSNGAVRRCEWEMSHGPGVAPLAAPDPGARPEFVETLIDDDAFNARVVRARAYVDRGEAERLVLARRYTAAARGSDPLDVYRGLRALAPGAYMYFMDFAESPMSEGIAIAGTTAEPLGPLASDGDAPDDVTGVADLRAAFPAAALAGTPTSRAASIIRELEPTSRHVFGGAVGYFSPCGRARLATVSQAVVLRRAQFEVMAGAAITASSTDGGEAAETAKNAGAALAAIRAAHDAAAARDGAARS